MDRFKISLKTFRALGYSVIDLRGRDYRAERDVHQFVVVPSRRNAYSDLLSSLLRLRLPEADAQAVMEEIYRHKWYESEKARRDIGLKAAARDWHRTQFAAWRAKR